MKTLLALTLVLFTACGGNTLSSKDDLSLDECGPLHTSGGGGQPAYACAYLVGACPTPGRSCFCWENGSVVCEPDHQWGFVLDNGCPGPGQGVPYTFALLNGHGCLGVGSACLHVPVDGGECDCSATTGLYACSVGLDK